MQEPKPHESYKDSILTYLRGKNGESATVTVMAKKFNVGSAATLAMLNELALAGSIRQRNADNRAQAFYVPTVAQLDAERRMAERTVSDKPLVVDKYRRELYARLDAARSSIPSIG